MKNIEKISEIIYEACRLEAIWSKRSVVPKPFDEREKEFKRQFIRTIEKYLKAKRLPTPKQAHNNWLKEYKKMGWKFGFYYEPEKKRHPDILPYEDLPQDEKEKDAIFLMAVWIVRNLVMVI
jgi:hypothetical protein